MREFHAGAPSAKWIHALLLAELEVRWKTTISAERETNHRNIIIDIYLLKIILLASEAKPS